MERLYALLASSITLCTLLYFFEDDSTPLIADVASSAFLESSDSFQCDIANYDNLRNSAIVYTWVNKSEFCYTKRRKDNHLQPERGQEIGELKYSLRSLLKFASFLEGPIYIVTPGQIPSWLDRSNPRISIIDQDDLLPKESPDLALPNFDTNVIEQYLYKIPGLTNIFIHMNDDYLYVKSIGPHRLFTCDGGVRFFSELNSIRHVTEAHRSVWLSSVRKTVAMTDAHYGGQHVYNFIKHAPYVYSRQAFEKIHSTFGKSLNQTLSHQERNASDVNIPLLHHIYMQEEGSKLLDIPYEWNPMAEAEDYKFLMGSEMSRQQLERYFISILENRVPEVLLALNDAFDNRETIRIVQNFMQELLPEPGPWELPTGKYSSILSNYAAEECKYDRSIIPPPVMVEENLRGEKHSAVRSRSNHERIYAFLEEVYANEAVGPNSLLGLLCGIVFTVITATLIINKCVLPMHDDKMHGKHHVQAKHWS
uniref:Exopolysaccharide phosphotransferase putative n=1 Tax=Albugo laibachii Nc14 TaxID=890382 RepID=F0WW11_9STRA|nr:exopolysaccharide phosphotransferase putative [Albugo laibachii Nc14]|eukprot:CCA25614.1 exopolysaccharide phosphotransferase putative [Albugo laibachii Nc14]